MQQNLLSPDAQTLMDSMMDITSPREVVSVECSADRKVLWVNVDGICVLRVCRIPQLIVEAK